MSVQASHYVPGLQAAATVRRAQRVRKAALRRIVVPWGYQYRAPWKPEDVYDLLVTFYTCGERNHHRPLSSQHVVSYEGSYLPVRSSEHADLVIGETGWRGSHVVAHLHKLAFSSASNWSADLQEQQILSI